MVILVNLMILANLVILGIRVILVNLVILVNMVILVNLVNWVILVNRVIPVNLVNLVIPFNLVILVNMVVLVNVVMYSYHHLFKIYSAYFKLLLKLYLFYCIFVYLNVRYWHTLFLRSSYHHLSKNIAQVVLLCLFDRSR